jgi:hypothetical protein
MPALPAQQLPGSERRCSLGRQITGLHAADRCAADQVPDGVFLVRVERVQHRWQAQKPYFTVRLEILEPHRFAGHSVSSHLYCNPEVLWKLNWFLRDFGYDTDLLGRDEVDEKALIGLRGVVKENTARHSGSSGPIKEEFAGERRKHQICQCRRRRSSSFHPAPGKWRFIVVLKPSFKPQLVCRL